MFLSCSWLTTWTSEKPPSRARRHVRCRTFEWHGKPSSHAVQQGQADLILNEPWGNACWHKWTGVCRLGLNTFIGDHLRWKREANTTAATGSSGARITMVPGGRPHGLPRLLRAQHWSEDVASGQVLEALHTRTPRGTGFRENQVDDPDSHRVHDCGRTHKVMHAPGLMEWLSTGMIKFYNAGHRIEMKRLPPREEATEDQLIEGDITIQRERKWQPSLMAFTAVLPNKLFLYAAMLPVINGQVVPYGDWVANYINYYASYENVVIVLLIINTMLIATLAVVCDRYVRRTSRTTTTRRSRRTSATSTTTRGAASSSSSEEEEPDPRAPPPSHEPLCVHKRGRKFHTATCRHAVGGSRYTAFSLCFPPAQRQSRSGV